MKILSIVLAVTSFACVNEHNIGDTPQPFGAVRWAVALGGPGQDRGLSLAIDSAGDVLAGGELQDGADFGSGPVATRGDLSAWVSKRSATDGSELWTLTYGTPIGANAQVASVTTDHATNVIVGGAFYRATDAFDPAAVIGQGVPVLAKYTPAGALAWVHGLGPAAQVQAFGLHVVVGSDDRIYLAGTYQGTLDLPDRILVANGVEAFLVAFEPNGLLRWGRSFPGLTSIHLALADDDTLIVSSSLHDRASLGGITVTPTAGTSELVASVTTDGDVTWARTIGPAGVDRNAGLLAIGADGQIISTSYTGFTSTVTAVDRQGDELWASAPVQGEIGIFGLVVAPTGAIVSGGNSRVPGVDFGDGTMTGPMYLAAHDPTGHFLAGRSFGDRFAAPGAAIASLAAGATGQLAFTGQLDATIDFGTGPVSAVGATDAVIVLLDTP